MKILIYIQSSEDRINPISLEALAGAQQLKKQKNAANVNLDVIIKKEDLSSYNLNCKIVGEINGIPCDLCAENLNIPIKIKLIEKVQRRQNF